MSSADVIVTHNITTVIADIVYSICNIFHYSSHDSVTLSALMRRVTLLRNAHCCLCSLSYCKIMKVKLKRDCLLDYVTH